MLNDLSQMIETPELLRLTLCIGRHKPRQPKRALFDRLVGILQQLAFDFSRAEFAHNVLGDVLTERLRQRSAKVLRILDCLALNPEFVVAFVYGGVEFGWVVHLDCTEGALDL